MLIEVSPLHLGSRAKRAPLLSIAPELLGSGAPLLSIAPLLLELLRTSAASTDNFRLLRVVLGVSLNATTVWNWVQSVGQKAMEHLQQELALLNSGLEPSTEKRSPELEQMPLIIGADGVMVPMRPQEKTPKGKTRGA